MSKPSKEARARYEAKNYKQIKFSLNVNTDADVIERLETVDSKRGYILELIRADIKKEK